MSECPYCGADETGCDWDWKTEVCSRMPKAKAMPSLLRPASTVTLPDDPVERVRITREGADLMQRLKEPKTV